MKIRFEGKPLSVNKIYRSYIRPGAKHPTTIKSEEYRKYEKHISSTVEREARGMDKLELARFVGSPLFFELVVYSPKVNTAKGSISKTFGDVDDFLKATIDSIFLGLNNAGLKVDDSQIAKCTAKKMLADREYFTAALNICLLFKKKD